MKQRIIIGFLVLLVQQIYGQTVYSNKVYNPNIKSIEFYPDGDPLGEAVLFLNEDIPLILAFDDLADDYKDFTYTFIHCDANWNKSELMPNEYLDGYTEDYVVDYAFSQNTKVPYVHYSIEIPNENIQFRFSGNYIVKVYPNEDSDHPIFTKRFYVVDPQCSIGGNVIAPSNPELKHSAQEVNFKVNISMLNSLFPSREIQVQLQQNGRTDNVISNMQPLSILDGKMDFNLQKDNVFPGLNNFRIFDISSLAYNTEYVYHINRSGDVDDVELILSKSRARSPYSNNPSQYGKFYINTKDYSDASTEAEYALVHFLFSSPTPLMDELVLLGDFNQWDCTQKLDYNYASKTYQTTILLKQGFYSYMYALKQKNTNTCNIAAIEGSHFQTPNNYFVRVYYRAPGTTYDQLVGWEQIINYTE